MIYSAEIRRRPMEALFDLQGERGEIAACLEGLAPALPERPNAACRAGEATLFWLGEEHWLLRTAIAREADLETRLARRAARGRASAVRVSDHYQGFDITGPEAPEIVAQATALDIHPTRFPEGGATFTEFFGQTALLSHEPGGGAGAVYALYLERSLADYIEACLRAAAG